MDSHVTLGILLVGTLAVPLQWSGDVPIRVRNVQIDPVDLSVTYEFVNEAVDVTAYEVSITRHFADGSVLVSTQGQDWFSSIGYAAVRAVVYSQYESWLPRYSDASPGTHWHPFPSGLVPKAALIDADVTLTAVIRLDGSARGRRSVLDRLFSERRAMLSEYTQLVAVLKRAEQIEDPVTALESIARELRQQRPGEVLAGPRESVRYAAEQMLRWSEEHPADASRVLGTLVKVVAQQQQFLAEQSLWKG
jgi:hypothetical protein